ncbi:MAG: hypothetical protein ACD_38C00148G0006 [uncultured bacterium]|uniref:Uncharacterized protein n=1 Tax=Candidatus Daviesbacteria bacterium GW2011_GWC2_40_12 TaxID=1618431 RepID=A0A0G0T4E0_9BACT|nr:MAG: hypothetical protein ACD_38C00148G0006 [uncultured bacterium]KKQ84620.1 MAG: hypothetical protein UT04_C0013G0005 [Candidatus Daviesbacteria bacterium GW2011_GWF2_38_7]KKR16201.1 MAG: hypothetical protein UT45_C0008G0076 [Candidatus Daviesbacteria bacterium GW2011_GWA2_39_33]KKR25060.1 MAG: hypothetical protein UT54_C0007G0004 [Candidatus Daviesbacteria bacterium GW2011_GWB1_39_5]KKR41980.1 MAG: hypothetical protein UT77_C0005G0095 [Candidatus Daviesbacteria bacterium GW2011_GWC2_40_12]
MKTEITPVDRSEFFSPLLNRKPLQEATLTLVSAFRKAANRIHRDERGSSDTGCLLALLALSVSAALVISSLIQSATDKSQNDKISVLQTAVAALRTPVATGAASEKLVVEIPGSQTESTWWLQKEVTIRPSDEFKPSKINTGDLNEDRKPESLVEWENIIEINGVSVEDAKLLQIDKPLVAWALETKDRGNNTLDDILDAISPKATTVALIKLKALIKTESGPDEKRYVYLPANTPPSAGFIEGYGQTPPEIRVRVDERNGSYFHIAQIGETDQGKLPAKEIGVVTPIY